MIIKKLKKRSVEIPIDVPKNAKETYVNNFLEITRSTARLMLFAGDQKIEHLNDDFVGETDFGPIAEDDADPEHLFRIADKATIGCFASQLGLIARYGNSYPNVPYLVKLNSKTNLVKKDQKDPLSKKLWSVEQVLEFKKNSGLKILGVGYTIYIGSEYEAKMLKEAAKIINKAHKNGLITVLWVYPRGKAVFDERDPHIIAGAAGVACCLGADFVKINYPNVENPAEALREAVKAAGRTKVVVAGGSSADIRDFLQRLHDQIHISNASGNATGRNIHQKKLEDAVNMCNAISSITLADSDVDTAMKIYEGTRKLKL